jgi:hypothetical protein
MHGFKQAFLPYKVSVSVSSLPRLHQFQCQRIHVYWQDQMLLTWRLQSSKPVFPKLFCSRTPSGFEK